MLTRTLNRKWSVKKGIIKTDVKGDDISPSSLPENLKTYLTTPESVCSDLIYSVTLHKIRHLSHFYFQLSFRYCPGYVTKNITVLYQNLY